MNDVHLGEVFVGEGVLDGARAAQQDVQFLPDATELFSLRSPELCNLLHRCHLVVNLQGNGLYQQMFELIFLERRKVAALCHLKRSGELSCIGTTWRCDIKSSVSNLTILATYLYQIFRCST